MAGIIRSSFVLSPLMRLFLLKLEYFLHTVLPTIRSYLKLHNDSIKPGFNSRKIYKSFSLFSQSFSRYARSVCLNLIKSDIFKRLIVYDMFY
jgi:hypothetical protein